MRPGPDPRSIRWIAVRIGMLAALLALGFGAVAFRVFQLQVLRRDALVDDMVEQYRRQLVLKPRRGPITDRAGVILAGSADARSVYVDPAILRKEDARGALLAKVARSLGLDPAAVRKKLAKGSRFVFLARRVSPAEADAVERIVKDQKLRGVAVVAETRRYYPRVELASQLLGVVGDDGTGLEGVELAADDLLAGSPAKVPSLRDGAGRTVLAGDPSAGREREGARVELTIDQGLQLATERALARACLGARAAGGMAVALDPRTGEILAMASWPPHNPNAPRKASELRNRAVADAFEPGSTMKTFSIAGALDRRAVTPLDPIDCGNGTLAIGAHVIHDHEAMGWVGPSRILAASSNVGAAKIAARLGKERLHDVYVGFGFGERPGSGLPGETKGSLPFPRADVTLATQAFGQGLSASPLQITAAMAAIANGGTLLRPHVVPPGDRPGHGRGARRADPGGRAPGRLPGDGRDHLPVARRGGGGSEGHRQACAPRRLAGRRQDGDRAEGGPRDGRLLGGPPVQLLRRLRPGGVAAGGGRHLRGRAQGRDLRRRGRGPGLSRGRRVRDEDARGASHRDGGRGGSLPGHSPGASGRAGGGRPSARGGRGPAHGPAPRRRGRRPTARGAPREGRDPAAGGLRPRGRARGVRAGGLPDPARRQGGGARDARSDDARACRLRVGCPRVRTDARACNRARRRRKPSGRRFAWSRSRMKLSAIIQGTGARGDLGGDPDIARVTGDSREVVPGAVFFALPGTVRDGHDFVPEAVRRGAVAIVAERAVASAPAALLLAPSSRHAMAVAAANFHGRPGDALLLAGVTGTNGKTTVAWLVDACARAAGVPAAMFGTVVDRWPGVERPASFTTPESTAVQALLAEARAAGARAAVLEVSSHALAQERVSGMRFRVAAFTNLTRDHLDYHGDMERYFAAKRRLFLEHLAPDGTAVVNVRDPWGARLADQLGPGRRLWRHGGRTGDELRVEEVVAGLSGIAATVQTPVGPVAFRSPLVGAHNLENLLCAAGVALALGLPPAAVARGLSESRGAPGRLERFAARGISVFVDYAHTDDALAHVLEALRALGPRRLLCVFGCGGDRDRGKRPLMGEAAGRGADVVIVTSDNPRSEDPLAIIGEILPGLERAGQRRLSATQLCLDGSGYAVEPDRRSAIALAVAAAREGDAVLVAGKGHEATQVIGRESIPFSDREEARKALGLA